jgi:hypothetical protein
MSKPAAKKSAKADDEETIEEFLFDLAFQANPTRFYPFPDEYRSKNTTADQLGDRFKPYSSEEFAKLSADLQKLKADPNSMPELYRFITNVNVQLTHHGTTFSERINEYEFLYPSSIERIRNHLFPQRSYLFHGSPIGNWHSIIRNGIKNMSSSRLMSAGQAYGSGIYLSDTLAVSAHYGSSGEFYCVAVVEFLSNSDFRECYKKGQNIYVVPDENVLFPRYLLKINNKFQGSATELLGFYTKQRNETLQNERKGISRRCERDIEGLLAEYPGVKVSDVQVTLYIKNTEYSIYLDGFPSWSPLAFDGISWYTLEDWTAVRKLIEFVRLLEADRCLAIPAEEFNSIANTIEKVKKVAGKKEK